MYVSGVRGQLMWQLHHAVIDTILQFQVCQEGEVQMHLPIV